jgi:hypothetical protein
MFNGRHIIRLIKYLNNNTELYKQYDIINILENGYHKYYGSLNYRLFSILSIFDANYYNTGINSHYSQLYQNNDFTTYCTLDKILNTFVKYIAYSQNDVMKDISNMDRLNFDIINNLTDIFKFCIHLAAKQSSNEQIYNSLKDIVKIIDTHYQYKNNFTFKLTQEMLQILLEYL